MKILTIFNAIYQLINYSYSVRGIFIFSFCALFLIIPKETLATVYYVSNSGNNNYKGTLTNPFKTIVYGLSKFKGSDTLYVRGGTYFEQIIIYQKSGTNNKPTVVMAFPGEKPIIDGKESLPASFDDPMVNIMSDYVVFDGFEVKNVDILGNNNSSGVRLNGNYITVQNCIVHDVWGTGITLMQDHNIVQDCVVYNTSMNNATNPGEQGNSAGISIRGYLYAGRLAEYHTIRRCIVHDIWGEAVSTVESDYSVIENNIVYDGWEVGIYVNNSTHCLVQRNLVYQTKEMGGNQVGIGHWDEGGSPLLNKNNIFINNIVYECRRNFYSTSMIGTLVSNNTFINSTYFACIQISANEYERAVFINNIIVQEGELLPIYAFSNPEMHFSHNLWSKTPLEDATGAGDIIGDPMFAKSGSLEAGKLDPKYFKILETSPAINKGIKNNYVTDDIFYNLRDPLPDIGASEYRIAVTGITVTGTGGVKAITTYKGTLQLSATILPINATNKAFSWSIKNGTGKASISPTGQVTAVSDGTVTATATSLDGSEVSGNLIITISGQMVAVTSIVVTGTDFKTKITTAGGMLQLNANILPINATNKSVMWSVQNGTGQALISSSGLLTPIADGIVTALATANDGSGVQGILTITIENQNVLLVMINKSELKIQMNADSNYRYLSLIDLYGNPIFYRNLIKNDSLFDVSQLLPGIYLVLLSGIDGNTQAIKVCKP